MIARQPGGHDPVRGPHLSPQVVAVKRLDDYAHGLGDNPHPLQLRLLEQLGLAPGQPAKIRDGNGELPRRGGDVAIMLRQHARDLGKVEVRTGGGDLGEMHR